MSTLAREPVPPESAVGAFIRLAVIVVGGVAVAIALHAVSVLVVVLAIVAMIMLHELGHFVAAKASGMKVTEYFLGFGPRLWSVRKGETDYGVKAIPAGGYVKVTGMTMLEDVDEADEARSYRQASFPRRLAVAVAGSTVHLLLALVLCWSFFVFVGTPSSVPYISGLLRFAHGATPAEKAGLAAGDEIVSVDGKAVKSFTFLEHEISSHAGVALRVTVRRDGRISHLVVRPVNDQTVTEYYDGEKLTPASKRPEGIIGVELYSPGQPVGPLVAVPKAFSEFGSLISATGHGIAAVFSLHGLSSFAHSVVTAGRHHASSGSGSSSGQTSVTSILGVIQVGSQLASTDPGELLILLALVNLFVGLVNLFPMLPLDGGHVAIAVYERVRSRRGRKYHADVMKLMPLAYLFLAFIVVIGLGALYANIVQPVHLPGG